MATGVTYGYRDVKEHLSPPARRVIEELIDARRDPEEVLRRVATEELLGDSAAYAYVREVLYRSLLELTGAGVRSPLLYAPAPATTPADPIAAG